MRKLIVYTLLIFTALVSNAQRFEGFGESTDEYVSKLEELYKTDANMNKDQKKQWEALVVSYDSVWNTFSSSHRKDIVKLSNLMIKKNIRARNGFYVFLQTQIAFSSSNQTPESYNQWLKGMSKYLSEHNIKIYNDAMAATLDLLANNCLYLSKMVKWSFDNNATFVFRQDTVRGVYADFLSDINLSYQSTKDRNTIYSTKGRLYLMEQTWEGKGGMVNWEKAGLNKDSVYATLKKYEVSLKTAGLNADSVTFTNKEYFSHSLEGFFTDLCSDKIQGKQSKYPLFTSYKREEIIRNIFPQVNYVGGFTQQGGRFLGTGDVKEPAKLVFYKDDTVFMVAKAIEHPFSREGIITEDCQVTFYVGKDSVYHPGTKMNFNKNTRQILCSDNKKGISSSPWVDSYHCIDIYTEAVYANLAEHTIEFTSIKGPSKKSFATFESNNYYSDKRWYEVQKMDEISPLERVMLYTKKTGKNQFTVKQFSKFTGLDVAQCKMLLMNLSLNGFMSYESYREVAIVKDKLFAYIKANRKMQDYDALRLTSSTNDGSANAVLNMYDMDLTMNGVKSFLVSDTHMVSVTPKSGKMTMQKNRDFTFDGLISAGRFKMSGKDCKFSYETFRFNLPKLDSMKFFVPSFTDSNTLVMIQTPIQKLNCELVIDAPTNKSSIKHLEGFPTLTSLENSFVYYDYNHIQGGVYHRDSFYFELKPFVIKNMFSFRSEDLVLAGELHSADIFPTIVEPLKIMPDYALGFKKDFSEQGIAAYNGRATYYNSIDLSANGLLGTGKFVYGASQSLSDMFVFHPDSMFCSTKIFDYKAPDVKVTKTAEHFYPKADYMIVEQKAEPFRMYAQNNSEHKGYLKVTSTSLSGAGENRTNELIVKAEDFKYYPDSYTSDSASLTIMSTDSISVAFQSQGLTAAVSLKDRKASFTSKNGVRQNDLPYLQYICFADNFAWDMDQKLLSLRASSTLADNRTASSDDGANSKDLAGNDLKESTYKKPGSSHSSSSLSNNNAGSSMGTAASADLSGKDIRELVDLPMQGAEFISVHPSQDSLSFRSLNAKLNLQTNELSAEGVYLVRCADAAIRPMNSKLTLHPGAVLDTIEKAEILFGTDNKYHKAYNSRVYIASRKLYSANGYMDFKNSDNKKSSIFFKEISSATGYSVGYAAIAKEEPLDLSSAFRFYGEISAVAADSSFMFDGGVSLALSCNEGKEAPFMKFKSKIDAQNIAIPISEAPVDVDGKRITTSLLFDEKNLQPLIAFFTHDKEADNVFLKAQGYLTYDNKSGEYRIASKEKLSDFENVSGSYLAINKNTCKAKGLGNIRLGLPLGGLVKTNNYGEIKADPSGQTTIKMSLALDFPFSDEALNVMGANMYDDMNLVQLEPENSGYKNYMSYIMGEKKGEEYYLDLVDHGEWEKLPEKMNFTMFFPDVNLQWDEIRNCYLSMGDMTVGIVGKHQVNKKMRSRMQMIKTGVSTEIRIYLEQDMDNWYYFSYNGAAMSAISSDENFNDFVKNAKKKEFKAENGKVYTFRLAQEKDKRDFIRNIELNDYKSSSASKDDTEEQVEDDE